MASPERSKVMTAEEVAEWLGMHPETIRRAARAGRIPARKFGGEWRFKLHDVERAVFGDDSGEGEDET